MKIKYQEHIFQMERCSFLLDVIRSRVVAILETEAHSNSILDCATILRVSPAYCDFVLEMKQKYPKHDQEMLCQEIYDCIWMHDNTELARFQKFDEQILKEWYEVRAKERNLRNGLLKKDECVANFKHAYYVNFGEDVDVIKKIEQEPEPTTETEPEDEDDDETVEEFEARLIREKLLCQMFKDAAIDEKTALKYMDAQDLPRDTFLKLVEIHTNAPDGGDE